MSYRKNTYEILKELGSDPNKGLSNEEVRKRRNQYGTNEMKKQKMLRIEKEQKRKEKETDKKTRDIKTLEDALPEAFRGESGITVERLSRMIDEKEKELAELEQDRLRLQEQIAQASITYEEFSKFLDIAPNWKQVFKESDIPTKRMLLASLIERIDVKDEDISIKFRIRIEDFEKHSGDGEKILETVGSDTIPYILCLK